MTTKPLKQVILAAYLPGVNNTTVWSAPRSKSRSSSTRSSTCPDRRTGKLDFFFLAEGLRLRRAAGSTTSTPSGGPTPSPC